MEDKLFDNEIMKEASKAMANYLLFLVPFFLFALLVNIIFPPLKAGMDIVPVVGLLGWVMVSSFYIIALGMEKLYAEIKALKGEEK